LAPEEPLGFCRASIDCRSFAAGSLGLLIEKHAAPGPAKLHSSRAWSSMVNASPQHINSPRAKWQDGILIAQDGKAGHATPLWTD